MTWKLLAAALIMASPLTAQAPDTGSVPRELVTVLAGGMMSNIVVGAPPESFPSALLPADGVILGSLGMYGNTLVAVRVAQGAEAARESLRARLLRTGWRHPVIDEPDRGGFESIGPWQRDVTNMLCSDSGHVELRTNGRRRPDLLTVSYTDNLRNSPCNPRFAANRRRWGNFIPLPTLRAPEGVQMTPHGGGNSDDYSESRATARSEHGAVVIVEKFLDQMREQGWTPITRVGDGDAAIASARSQHDSLGLLVASINVIRLSTEELTLNLTVNRPETQPGRRSRSTRIPPP